MACARGAMRSTLQGVPALALALALAALRAVPAVPADAAPATPQDRQHGAQVWVVSLPRARSSPAQAAQVVEEARPVEAAVDSVVEGLKSILRSSEDVPHPAPLADLAVNLAASPSDINELAVGSAWNEHDAHDSSRGHQDGAPPPAEVLEAIPSPDSTLAIKEGVLESLAGAPLDDKQVPERDVPHSEVPLEVPVVGSVTDVQPQTVKDTPGQDQPAAPPPVGDIEKTQPGSSVSGEAQFVPAAEKQQEAIPALSLQQDEPPRASLQEPQIALQDNPAQQIQLDPPQATLQQTIPEAHHQQDVPQDPPQDILQTPSQQDVSDLQGAYSVAAAASSVKDQEPEGSVTPPEASEPSASENKVLSPAVASDVEQQVSAQAAGAAEATRTGPVVPAPVPVPVPATIPVAETSVQGSNVKDESAQVAGPVPEVPVVPVLQSAADVAALNAQLLANADPESTPEHAESQADVGEEPHPAPPSASQEASAASSTSDAAAQLIAAVNDELSGPVDGGEVPTDERESAEPAAQPPAELHSQAAQINMDLATADSAEPVVSEAVLEDALPASPPAVGESVEDAAEPVVSEAVLEDALPASPPAVGESVEDAAEPVVSEAVLEDALPASPPAVGASVEDAAEPVLTQGDVSVSGQAQSEPIPPVQDDTPSSVQDVVEDSNPPPVQDVMKDDTVLPVHDDGKVDDPLPVQDDVKFTSSDVQEAIEAEASSPAEGAVKDEAPTPVQVAVKDDAPSLAESVVKDEVPEPVQDAVVDETLQSVHDAVQDESPGPVQDAVVDETLSPANEAVKDESPGPVQDPVKDETPSPVQTPVKESPLPVQDAVTDDIIAPVQDVKDDAPLPTQDDVKNDASGDIKEGVEGEAQSPIEDAVQAEASSLEQGASEGEASHPVQDAVDDNSTPLQSPPSIPTEPGEVASSADTVPDQGSDVADAPSNLAAEVAADSTTDVVPYQEPTLAGTAGEKPLPTEEVQSSDASVETSAVIAVPAASDDTQSLTSVLDSAAVQDAVENTLVEDLGSISNASLTDGDQKAEPQDQSESLEGASVPTTQPTPTEIAHEEPQELQTTILPPGLSQDDTTNKPEEESSQAELQNLSQEQPLSIPESTLQDAPPDSPQEILQEVPQDTTVTSLQEMAQDVPQFAPQDVPLDSPKPELQGKPEILPDAAPTTLNDIPEKITDASLDTLPTDPPQTPSQQSAEEVKVDGMTPAVPQEDVVGEGTSLDVPDDAATEGPTTVITDGPIAPTTAFLAHDLAPGHDAPIESMAPATPSAASADQATELTQSETILATDAPSAAHLVEHDSQPDVPETTVLPEATATTSPSTDRPSDDIIPLPAALPSVTEIDEVPGGAVPTSTPTQSEDVPVTSPVTEAATYPTEEATQTPMEDAEVAATTSGGVEEGIAEGVAEGVLGQLVSEQSATGIKAPGEPFLNPDDPNNKPETEEESNAILEETDGLPDKIPPEEDKSDEQSAEASQSSEEQNTSSEETNQSAEQQNNGGSSEESSASQSSEEQNNSSEETNESAEQQNAEPGPVGADGEPPAAAAPPGNEEIPAANVTQGPSSMDAASPTESLQPVAVSWLRVRSEVQLRFAHTLVRAALHNPAPRAQEVQLSLTLPETGYVTGLSLESEGKIYKAYVRERKKADGEYQQAALNGQTAAQVRQTSARDSAVMSLLVTVAARASLTVNLTYEELLGRRRGQYRHAVSIDPGQEVDDVRVDVFILESRNLSSLAVSAAGQRLYSVDERELTKNGLQNYTSGPLTVRRQRADMAHVRVSASREQQLALWKPSSARTATPGTQQQGAVAVAVHALPALTIEYDVDRSKAASGDLLLMDGYFVHFFAPPEVPPLRKHAIFVLDTSGSMWGHKLKQLQSAMNRILDSLHPDDFFSIVQFSSQVTEWSPHTLEVVGLRDKEATLPANKDHINKAKKFINSMEASGGTNIGGALRSAVRLAGKRDYDRWPTYRAGSADRPQPLIVFLTDGLPTVGTLSLGRVLAQTRAQNAEIKAAIFSLSFGTRSNWRFMQRLSLQNDGFARRIYEAGDAAQQLQDFYQEIASPLLANVTFNYVSAKVEGVTVTRRSFPLLYGGGELVVAGKVADGVRSLDAEVEVWGAAPGASAAVGAAPGRRLLRASAQVLNSSSAQAVTGLIPPPPPNKKKVEPKPTLGLLERLWAYLSVKQLLDLDLMKHEEDVVEDAPKTEPGLDQPRRRAVYLALKYGFVTRVTSLVVVTPASNSTANSTSASTRETALRPVPADGAERDAENLTGNNKFSELSLTRPSPGHVPMSFKPLLFSQQADNATQEENLPLTAISWLSQHTDSAGRLRLGPAAFSLELPPKQELQRLMAAAANQCPGRSCRPLASCVQSSVAASFMVFRDFFCPLGMYAGVCCPH